MAKLLLKKQKKVYSGGPCLPPSLFKASQSSFHPAGSVAGRVGGFQRGLVSPLCFSWQSFWHAVRLATADGEHICMLAYPAQLGWSKQAQLGHKLKGCDSCVASLLPRSNAGQSWAAGTNLSA